MIDYAKYRQNYKFYSGAEKKIGFTMQNRDYFAKFQKNSREGLRFNHVSEYLGSHIFALLGLTVQETYLGLYEGKEVVVVRDFLQGTESFIPFNGVGDSSLDISEKKYLYEYEDIICMIEANVKLTDIAETEEQFWKMFVVDALLGNFDRHGSNWGFIKNDNVYRMAPVFDNGSCLFPQLNTDEKIQAILSSQEEMEKRTYQFPTSQIKRRGKKSSYYDIINSLQYEGCNHALKYIVDKYDAKKIGDFIEKTPFITALRKDFYKKMIQIRFEKILWESYEKMKRGE
ncbi:MAG: HipA domain-containing protein [Lachnospiraceae bacterium]|nr:HipA domain-containing protein [Lachnospiraceae bacterium]